MGCHHRRQRSRHPKSSSSRGQQYPRTTIAQQFRPRPVAFHPMAWHRQCLPEQMSRHARRVHQFGNVTSAPAAGSPAAYHRRSVTRASTSRPVQCTLAQSRPAVSTPLQISHHDLTVTPVHTRHNSIQVQLFPHNRLQRAPVGTRRATGERRPQLGRLRRRRAMTEGRDHWFSPRSEATAKTPAEKAITPTNCSGSNPLSVKTANAIAATSSFFILAAAMVYS